MRKNIGSALAVLAALVILALVFTFILVSRSARQAEPAVSLMPTPKTPQPGTVSPLVSPLNTPFNTPEVDPRDLLLTPSPTPGPTFTPKAFPTVVVTPPPVDKPQPADLATLWYASYPASGSELTLHGVHVDAEGQQWGEKAIEKNIDLDVSPRPPGLIGGFPRLDDFSPSPDGVWVLQAIDFRSPLLINLATGDVQEVESYQHGGGAGAFTWLPDGKHFVALPLDVPGNITASSVDGTSEVVIPFPGEKTFTNTGELVALAYSPDGKQLLDAVNIQPVYQVREYPLAQISIRNGEQGERKVAFELKQANLILGSLRWLTSNRVIFIANVYSTDKPPFWTENQETQLWQLDLSSGQAKPMVVLGQKVEYGHQPTPIGPDEVLIVTVDAVQDGKETATSLHLINLDTGEQKTIVQLQGKRISRPQLSPDGKWIAYVVNTDEYAEVWLASLDGQNQHAIAGPTSLNAPIFWTK